VPGPGGPRPLAADADRERLVALLREHYAVGLFGLDELDRRVGLVLSAQYLDEMAAAIADLPGVPAPGGPASGSPASGGPAIGGSATGGAAIGGSATGRPARRRRGHAHADQPAAGWIPTNERFRDPSTRTIMRVWVDPADQSRHYVPEPDT
jgi:Domain of unknown function (DUF1707)